MDEFIKVSQQLGKNILLAQGAGGNTSIKIRNKMYVKASGFRLKLMTETNGIACCMYKPLEDFFINKHRYTKNDEKQFLELVDKQLVQSETLGKPSMEIGFHTVIPSKYVFHLHSVYANVFNFMKYGSHHIRHLFKDIPYTVVNYKNPGYELAFHLSKNKSLPPLIFLKNHGIIIHGEDIKKCFQLTELLHETIEAFLKKHHVYIPFHISSKYTKLKNYAFPDSAVFSHVDISELPEIKKKELLEINSAQRYIVDTIKRLSKQPVYLSKNDVNKLLNMDQEKHRVEIFKT